MKKEIKNAFTLVELLAVIVILAIILVIAVPKVINIISDAKKATFESTAKMIVSQAEKQKVQNTVLGKTEDIECEDVVKLNDVDYETCIVEFDENEALITMTGSGKFDGLYICYGTKTDVSVQEEPCGGAETPATCFDYEIVYDVEVGNKTSCINYLTSDFFGLTYDQTSAFCSGNIIEPMTFSQHINKIIYEEKTTIEELVANDVVTNIKEVIEITGYDSTCGTDVNVPRKINNTLVYGIGNNAFQGTTVTSVKLPTSLRYIGDSAFISTASMDAYGTTDPYVSTNPEDSTGSVEITGELDLSKLDKLETIGNSAFEGNQITNIKFPSNLQIIGNGVFKSNTIEGTLDLSNIKVTKIGEEAFQDNQIKSIILPTSLEDIDYAVFKSNAIEELDLSNTNIDSIGANAFASNQIESVKFPTIMHAIYDDAFRDNEISGILDLSNTKITSIYDDAFASNQIESVKFPTTMSIIHDNAFIYNEISGILDLSNTNVTIIEKNVFDYNQITSVKLPTSIMAIGAAAFNSLTNNELTTIINSSRKSFDWSNIISQGTSTTCTFATGTCGSITIKAS